MRRTNHVGWVLKTSLLQGRILLPVLIPLLAFAGCSGQPDSAPAPQPGAVAGVASTSAQDELLPGQLLSRMIGAYQSAAAYSDTGQLRLREKQGDRWVENAVPFSVAFERPNRLLVRAYQAAFGCDGKEFRARITDEPSGNLDNQMVVRPAPAKLTLGDLYEEGENLDPVLAEALAGELGVVPVTLNLLLAEQQPLAELLQSSPPLERLPDAKIGEDSCARVAVGTQSGDLVFWIDSKTKALRRLEYPSAQLAGQMAEGTKPPQMELIADFGDARLDPALPGKTFTLDVPATAKKVRYFVIPPRPLPTKRLGEKVSDFWFSDLKGDRFSREDLSLRIAVLVWYQDHPACQQLLMELEKVYRLHQDRSELVFRVVNVDGPDRSHRDVQAVLDDWGVTIPAVRDVAPCGPDVFGIKDAPTLVILDAEGVLQYCEVGANPYLAKQLRDIIARALAEDPLADEILAAHKQQQQAYVDQLALAMSQQPTTVVPLADVRVAEEKPPEQLQLTRQWCSTSLQKPGNVLVVDRGSPNVRFFALDGWQTVVEIDREGMDVDRRRLQLPKDGAVSRLRSAANGEGRRWFVGFEVHGRRLFVWNEKWELAWTYPDGDERHPGLADVRIADLGGNGRPQVIVGFWGPVGIHGVSPAGRRQWGCRELISIVSLAVSMPDEVGSRQVLATSDQGPILPINRYGNTYPKIRVGRWPIHVLYAAEFPSPKVTPYCGLSYAADGRVVAVGITAAMEDAWTYPLPAGTFRTQIEPVTSGAVLPDGTNCWLFAAPDGTVHFVSEDGKFTDRLAYGVQITGLAAARVDDVGALVITSPGGPIECLRIEKR